MIAYASVRQLQLWPESHKGGWAGILAKSNGPRSYSFYTTSDGGGTLHFSSMGGSNSNKTVELNEWQHVVAQHTGKSHIYYINGENNLWERRATRKKR